LISARSNFNFFKTEIEKIDYNYAKNW
jgi:hypothetical protein